MRVALVCIAKNEDPYIQEWIDYNKKLGFDDIFIYQNDWRWDGESENVHKFVIDGKSKQREAYNHFIKNYRKEYDWVAFFDVDEFLVLKKHENIQSFISDYLNYPAIGINWVLFGDSGYKTINNEYGVVKRFTMRKSTIDQHVKCIVKISEGLTMDIHNPNHSWYDTEGKVHTGPFNMNGKNDVAQINHYFTKTEEEFLLKCDRGRADITNKRTINEFYQNNFNDIEDLTAFKFFNEL
jgi:hypothetical protein